MEKGTIVLVRFPFTDYTSEKLRPALIISTNTKRDVCVAFISSVIPITQEETDYVIREKDKEFLSTGLKKDSVFKMNKIATVDKDVIMGKLGNTSEELQNKLDKKLKIVFGL